MRVRVGMLSPRAWASRTSSLSENRPQTFQQCIELARGSQVVETAEAMTDTLDDTAVDALVFDEEEVGAVAARLRADKHRVVCVTRY